ncbi:MAG: CRISPR-associated endoribonuclease Cas6 [Eubacteriales bacterium]|nr:CRISPR-associated endoribonuclease Cas6 [Eubacteriales bacterium]
MKVWQIRLKLYLLQDISVNRIQTAVTSFIDFSFRKNEHFIQMHKENIFKNYVYDLPYPIERDKVYKQGNVYTLTIRTIDARMAAHFLEVCANNYTKEMKGLTAEIRMIPKKHIDYIYNITTAVLKDELGYWRKYMTIDDFEDRLKINLIKKWNFLGGERIDENFLLCTFLEFKNNVPIAVEYKNIKLLGDKFLMHISNHPIAQDLAYMALGTGVLEMNSRGFGFVNYRWL